MSLSYVEKPTALEHLSDFSVNVILYKLFLLLFFNM